MTCFCAISHGHALKIPVGMIFFKLWDFCKIIIIFLFYNVLWKYQHLKPEMVIFWWLLAQLAIYLMINSINFESRCLHFTFFNTPNFKGHMGITSLRILPWTQFRPCAQKSLILTEWVTNRIGWTDSLGYAEIYLVRSFLCNFVSYKDNFYLTTMQLFC